MQNKYRGWISVLRSEGYADRFVVEHHNAEGEGRIRKEFSSPGQAVEYFDTLAGEPVKLMETPLGAYRVYTEVPPASNEGRNLVAEIKANQLRTEVQRLIGAIRHDMEVPWVDRPSHQVGLDEKVVSLCALAEKLAELTK